MQAGRARTLLASAAALVVLAGASAGCSSKDGGAAATSADPCQQIVNDAVAAWKAYTSKHGTDLQNVPDDAKDDFKTLTEQVQSLQTQVTEKNCNVDEIGRGIQEQAPDFLGAKTEGSNAPTTAP